MEHEAAPDCIASGPVGADFLTRADVVVIGILVVARAAGRPVRWWNT